MNGSEEAALIIVLPMTIIFWAWVVWVILEWRKVRHKSKLQEKIVEKFTTAQEFNDFLQSQEGNKFINFLRFNGRAPSQRILSSLSKGVILTTLGISLIIVGKIFTEEMEYFVAFGVVIIALGVGFIIATFISYKLSKKWGIMNKES